MNKKTKEKWYLHVSSDLYKTSRFRPSNTFVFTVTPRKRSETKSGHNTTTCNYNNGVVYKLNHTPDYTGCALIYIGINVFSGFISRYG